MNLGALIMGLAIMLAPTTTPAPAPAPLPDLASEFARYDLLTKDRLLFAVGELHGARENAAFVKSLTAYLQAQGYEVRVFVEQPADGMLLADAGPEVFLQSLRSSAFWSGSRPDGRSGGFKACTLFDLQSSGAILAPIDTPGSTEPAAQSRDDYMADRVVQALTAADQHAPKSVRIAAIVWVGNFHMYTPPGGNPAAFDTARARLSGWTAIPLYLAARTGSAFNCRAAGCAVHPVSDLSQLPLGLSRQDSGEYQFIVERFSPDLPAGPRLPSARALGDICG